MPATASNHLDAADAGLRYVSDDAPGIRRIKAGRHFRYLDGDGRPMRDPGTLARIRALAIPPAWTDVWICPRANGHIQATGRDARGRKQYRYHPRWQEVRDAGKFDRLIAFGKALPRLRRRLRRDLALRGFPREKVLAIVTALLAETLLRVGNDAYARDNRSYGLTTLRDRHVSFTSGGRVRLRFRGKSGSEQDVQVDDARLARLVKRCRDLPGQALFQYRSDDNGLCPVDSGDVNDYLRDAMGEAFTAKDFRTWGGTLVAFRLLACTELPPGRRGGPPSERALVQCQNAVIAEVAATLGNTAAVCRKSYIDPVVFEGWRDGRLQRAAAAVGSNGARGERQWERAALRYLKQARRAAKRQARTHAGGASAPARSVRKPAPATAGRG